MGDRDEARVHHGDGKACSENSGHDAKAPQVAAWRLSPQYC